MKRITLILHGAYLHLALRLFLGATFIASAASKLPMQTRFVDVVKEYHLLPDPLAFAYGSTLPWLELLIGAYFLLGILSRINAVATLLVGATFLVANISAMVKGMETCGSCFGEAFPLSASHALVFDGFILLAAVILLTVKADAMILSLDGWFAARKGQEPPPAEPVTGEEN